MRADIVFGIGPSIQLLAMLLDVERDVLHLAKVPPPMSPVAPFDATVHLGTAGWIDKQYRRHIGGCAPQ